MRMAVAIRLGRVDTVAQHERRGAGRLKAAHHRQAVGDAGLAVLTVALPVARDVAGVAHRDAVVGGWSAEHVADLEGTGLLALDAVGLTELTRAIGSLADASRTMSRATSKLPAIG